MKHVSGAVAAVAFLALAAAKADAQVDLAKASNAYYSLHRLGFQGAACSLKPDWADMLKGKGDAQQIAAATAKLDQIQIALVVDPSGNAQVTVTPPKADNAQMAGAFQQITDGARQMVIGFFDTWKLFSISAPLPAQAAILSDEPISRGREIKYKDGEADVATDLFGDLITSIHVQTSGFDSTIRPMFEEDPNGMVLSGYVANYVEPGGANKTHLEIAIKNQTVNGLKFPATLDLGGDYQGTPLSVKVAFAECRITRR